MDLEERKRNIIRHALTVQAQQESSSSLSVILFACFMLSAIIACSGLALPMAIGHLTVTLQYFVVLCVSVGLSILFFIGYTKRLKYDSARCEVRKSELFNKYNV